MESVIFGGRGEAFNFDGQGHAFDPDATQSQDGRGQYGDDLFGGHDEDEIDDHGNSWHEDDDMYCEDEEEGSTLRRSHCLSMSSPKVPKHKGGGKAFAHDHTTKMRTL